MKNGKNPTLAQKKLIDQNGYAPGHWLVVKDTPQEMVIVSRKALKKRLKLTKSIRKGEV